MSSRPHCAQAAAELDQVTPIDQDLPAPSALPRFLRANFASGLLLSALILVPCFWHKHIEAGDLGSHLYNAWLVSLISRGQAPGLSVVPQRNNVLFDWMLSGTAKAFGFFVAEKISVAFVVLAMFWGAFALVSALARRPAWPLIPAIAMLTYGWVFQSGFFNFYLALALSFWALAAFCAWRGPARFTGFILIPLIWLANPLGLLWLVASAGYVWLTRSGGAVRHVALLLVSALLLATVHFYLWSHFNVEGPKRRWFLINGTDQIVVLNHRYRLLAAATFLLAAVCFLVEAARRRCDRSFWKALALPAGLYVLVELAVVSLPSQVFLPEYAAPLAYMVERLSLISAVLACALLATLSRQRWLGFGFAAIALIYFSLLYRDTGRLSRLEDQAALLVEKVARGRRVLQMTVHSPADPAGSPQHYLDRVCIGRCFAYANYEPSSLHFRVRANQPNPIVVNLAEDSRLAELGKYVVKSADLPVFELSFCDARFWALCLRELHLGEQNGRLDPERTR